MPQHVHNYYGIMTYALYTSQYISISLNRKTTLQILKVFPNVVPQCTNHITFQPVLTLPLSSFYYYLWVQNIQSIQPPYFDSSTIK